MNYYKYIKIKSIVNLIYQTILNEHFLITLLFSYFTPYPNTELADELNYEFPNSLELLAEFQMSNVTFHEDYVKKYEDLWNKYIYENKEISEQQLKKKVYEIQ